MEYIFTDAEGAQHPVATEKWAWAVIYDDNTELHQFDDQGVFHQFKEIDTSRVKTFVMYAPSTGGRIDIPVNEDMQLFHFYTRLSLEDGVRQLTIYCFGWKSRSTGAMTYHYILPNDTQIITDKKIDNFNLYDL